MYNRVFETGRKLVTSPAVAAYGFKGTSAVASFAATALLARMVGPATLGHFGFAVVSATLLGFVAIHGLDIVMLREVAGDLRQGLTGAARGMVRFALRSVAVAAVVITLLFVAVASSGEVAALFQTERAALLAAAAGIASVALYRLGLAGLRGTGHPVAGQFWEGANSFLFVAIVASLWLTATPVTASTVVLLFFACQLGSVASIWLILRRDIGRWAAAEPVDGRRMRAAGLPIMLTQATQMLQDWLLLALIAGSLSAAAVGSFRVTMQIIMVIALVVTTGETYLSGKVAADLRAGRPDVVWQRHRRATVAMALVLGPGILACVYFPEPLLRLAFGPAFVAAAPALAIMSAGQVAKLITGPIGGLLAMSGHEKWLLWLTIISLMMLVGLALWLVPILGLSGAAIAQAVPAAFRALGSYLVALRYIPKVPVAKAGA